VPTPDGGGGLSPDSQPFIALIPTPPYWDLTPTPTLTLMPTATPENDGYPLNTRVPSYWR